MALAFLAEIATPPSAPLLTREIFGNIPGWSRLLFYLAAVAALAVWGYGICRRAKLWRRGRPGGHVNLASAAGRLLRDALLQGRFRGRPLVTTAHVLFFSGFIVLLIGTILVGIEHWSADLLRRSAGDPVFHKGVYFGVYELVTDTFGVAFLIGCGTFLVRRLRQAGSFERSSGTVGVVALLLAIGVTGYVVEGLRIIFAQTPLPGLSPVGYLFAQTMAATGVDSNSARTLHFASWWLHSAMALGFIAWMPYSRMMHALAGAVNLAIRDNALGEMRLVSLEEVEATGLIGVATFEDFHRSQLVELDACISCGRCQDVCPAHEAGKPLSPRNVVQDLVSAINVRTNGSTPQAATHAATAELPRLAGGVIAEETLWSCTTCQACADICPLGISPVRMITDLRRNLIAEGALRGSPATALQKTERAGNPWGLSAAERMSWAAGLNVPLARDHADFDVLYWVGCAAAYERRAQRIARSVVQLLQAANVNFAVLGPEERCTGETARRMGDELLFQQLAEQNVAALASRGVRKIVAHCPHCVNSLRRDYPQLGGDYEVVHHSELLAQLIAEGRLPQAGESARAGPITFHDPCYLARANGITEQPRQVLGSVSGNGSSLPIVELPRNRRDTACCGAGGGRMWFDDPLAQRVGQGRVREIAAAGASTVAVSCPFCLIMLGDGLAAEDANIEVRDIAEILLESLNGSKTPAGSTEPTAP